MPKFPPPPRNAQKRSLFSSALARNVRPSAVTTRAETRLSTVMPYCVVSQPKPPPSVSPEMPVVELMPSGVARPKAWVSRSTSASVAPGPTKARRANGIDAHGLQLRQINHETVIAERKARDVVAPAPHRDEHARLAREVHRCDHVGHAAAAHDRGRPFVDHGIPDRARLVVTA